MGSATSKAFEDEEREDWLKKVAKWEKERNNLIANLKAKIENLAKCKYDPLAYYSYMEDISYLLENEAKILANKSLINLIHNW